jgi:hypothetical protein
MGGNARPTLMCIWPLPEEVSPQVYPNPVPPLGRPGLPLHSWKVEPSNATKEASTRHLLSDKSPQGSSSLRARVGGGSSGCKGGAACAFFREGALWGAAGQV